METLQNAYRDDDDDVEITPNSTPNPNPNPNPNFDQSSKISPISNPNPELNSESMITDALGVNSTVEKGEKTETLASDQSGNSGNDFMEEDVQNVSEIAVTTPVISSSNGGNKKVLKKKSKNNNSVWTKPTSRKGKKKAKNFGNSNNNSSNNNGGSNNSTPRTEDTVLATPVPRLPDKNEDTVEAKICLSKVFKAEKVELSDDRLSAGSCKGYRMVRATRGVSEGAWFFEIKVVCLGETGHCRVGWSMEKGDLQAPVGYDRFSYGYRDIDGCKVHKATREAYGEEGYKEGDVIGFYISLPEGDSFVPKLPHLVVYKGQKYSCDSKEEPVKTVPGSEISFFKNGVCQGVAFKDLCGACYYPAASMYTLPNQPNCVVKFNFGPDFECFPTDFGDRPIPKPMIEVPYRGADDKVENGATDENKQ